jgi:hypothetical protein
MEPYMMEGGAGVNLFGGLVGTGPGAGMSLMFVMTALAGIAVGLGAYLIPTVRDVEDILPDHKAEIATDVPPDGGVPEENGEGVYG